MSLTEFLRDDFLPWGTKSRKFLSLVPYLETKEKILLIGGENSNNVAGLSSLLKHKSCFALLRKAYGLSSSGQIIRENIPEERRITLSRERWHERDEIAKGFGAYIVPEGAVHPASIPGLKTLADDVIKLEKERGKPFDTIWIDAGTGLSAAVLIHALGEKKHSGVVHVLLLASQDFEKRLQFVSPSPPSLRFELHRPSRYKSFGTPLPKRLLDEFQQREKISFHPLYSGKLYDFFSQQEQKNALFIHTGS